MKMTEEARTYKKNASQSIFVNCEDDKAWIVVVEPECDPYLLKKGDPLEIEFVGGCIQDNLEITIMDKTLHIQEKKKPFASEVKFHGIFDHLENSKNKVK